MDNIGESPIVTTDDLDHAARKALLRLITKDMPTIAEDLRLRAIEVALNLVQDAQDRITAMKAQPKS